MWRQGTVTVDGTDPLKVLEEDTVVPSPTTASTQPTDPGDLYLQETLTRWDGWSLAVPRVGKPFQDQDLNAADSGSQRLQHHDRLACAGLARAATREPKAGNQRRLPRLRFGQAYQIRARAVDLAGNALPVDNAPVAAKVVSPALKHLRFEPVPAPRVLLVTPPGPAGAEEVVVIRSESATVDGTAPLDNGQQRPARRARADLGVHGRAARRVRPGRPPACRWTRPSSLYTDLARRDAVDVSADGKLTDPCQPARREQPVPLPAVPADQLPARVARPDRAGARPADEHQQATVARLPFDTAPRGLAETAGHAHRAHPRHEAELANP